MKDIILHADYISDQPNIRNLFLNTKYNLYLKKGSTGIGGTTTILEATDATRIVVSPSVGMIQGKEKSISNKNCFFIYGGSKDTWDDFFTCMENKVVNTTPDQILILKEHNLRYYNEILNMTIFVDEIHQYIPDSEYRNKLGDFLYILFNDWKANWILSTATDNRIGRTLLDIPPGKLYKSFNIKRPNEPIRTIELKRGKLTAKFIGEVFSNSLTRGRKLIIATNSTKLHKDISQMKGYSIINLVGSNIGVKLKTHKVADEVEDIDWNNADIIMISSKFFAGFDIPLDCDIIIDTNPHMSSNLIGPNDIRQIIGRGRKSVERIILNVDYTSPNIESKNHFIPTISVGYADVITKLEEKANTIVMDNWFNISAEIINDLKHYSLLFPPVLKGELIRYDLTLINYKEVKIQSVVQISSKPFYKQIEHLLSLDIETLKLDFGRIRKYLKFKIDGVFSPDLAIMFWAAILIKKQNIEIEIKKNDRPVLFYQKLNKLFKDDEYWNLLYGAQKCKMWMKGSKKIAKHSQIDPKHEEYLQIRSQPSKEIAMYSSGYFDCYNKSLDKLKEIGIIPDEYEGKKLLKRCKEVFERNNPAEFTGYKTREQLLMLVSWANLFILNGGRESYNFPLKRNRVYSPLTQIPGPLRSMIATKLVEIDIKQANPTFIDEILGTRVSEDIYDRISNIWAITRDDAKVRYNTYLNNDKADPVEVFNFFNIIGYGKEKAIELTQLITSQKGAVYDKMVEKEKEIIESFADTHLPHLNWFRFHDAIIISESEVRNVIYNIPDKFQNVKLGFKYYNDGTPVEINDLGFIL